MNVAFNRTEDRQVIREKFLEIGNELASIWGAACKDARINNVDKSVIFQCVENGEYFETKISFEELEEEYGYDLPVMV